MIKNRIVLLTICLPFFGLPFLDASATAQVGRGVGGFPGSVGGISGGRGAQSGFSARSVNPNFNPRGSMSTFQNLNPRGSLSPALNLNPQGSLLRPRTSGVTGSLQTGDATSPRSMVFQPTTVSKPSTAYPVPLTPNYAQLRILPRSSVMSWTKAGLQQFENSLSEFKNAEAWRNFFQLDEIQSELESAIDQPLNEASRKRITDMVFRFDTVATESKYKKVKLLPGFRATWTSLRELVRADSGDQQARLIRSATALNRELKYRQDGKAWQEYFALPELFDADASSTRSAGTFRIACEKTNDRFERTLAAGDMYRQVTDLTEFQATAENLKSLLQKNQQPQGRPTAADSLNPTTDPTETSPVPSSVTIDEQSAVDDLKSIPAKEVGDHAATPNSEATTQPAIESELKPAIEPDRANESANESANEPAPVRPGEILGEQILFSVVDLDRKLAEVAPNSEWPKRLSLDKLRSVISVSSKQPHNDSERETVEGILKTYQTIAKNDEDKIVNTLPEFTQTLNALQNYLGR